MTGRKPLIPRPQFSLQTFILVIALIALAIGWWSDHYRLSEQLRKERMRVQFLETSRIYDFPARGSQ